MTATRLLRKSFALLIALTMLLGVLPIVAMASTDAQDVAAQTLFNIGLMKGVNDDPSNPDFDLDRVPTRIEGLIMLIRLMGVEAEALDCDFECPFEDVPAWAVPYVAYAFEMGWTKGISETEFNPDGRMTATQYLTFVLRALGYVDGVSFTWDTAWELTDSLGITDGEFQSAGASFLRGDMVLVSLFALEQPLAGSGTTLIGSLIEAGAVPADAAKQVTDAVDEIAAAAATDPGTITPPSQSGGGGGGGSFDTN